MSKQSKYVIGHVDGDCIYGREAYAKPMRYSDHFQDLQSAKAALCLLRATFEPSAVAVYKLVPVYTHTVDMDGRIVQKAIDKPSKLR